MGSVDSEAGDAIVVDGSGNSYVTGTFRGTVDFDPDADVVNLASSGESDAFVAKYSPSGALIWAFGVGGTGTDIGNDIALQGEFAIIVGTFEGRADFNPGPALQRMTSAGLSDEFVMRVSRSTGALSWAKRIGAAQSDYAFSVATFENHVYVGGSFYETVDFDPGAGTANRTANSKDAYILRLTTSGAFGLVRVITGALIQDIRGLETDASGNILAAGDFSGTAEMNPGTGTSNRTSAGSSDGFVLKLTAAAAFSWARQMGGTSNDGAVGIVNNAVGAVFVVGTFRNTVDFDNGTGTASRTSAGLNDAFVAGYTSAGAFSFVATAGTTGFDVGSDITVDGSSRLVVAGHFSDTVDFDPGAGTQSLASLGEDDAFVWHLSTAGAYVDAYQLGGGGSDRGSGVAAFGTDVISTGSFSGQADFDPDGGVEQLNAVGGSDAFVSRVDMP